VAANWLRHEALSADRHAALLDVYEPGARSAQIASLF
jgi:hypothetical protein